MTSIDTVLEYFEKIEKKISKSELVTQAKADLLKSLTNSSLSQEKRSLHVQQFSEQVALNFVNMAFEKAMEIDGVIADINLKEAQKSLIDEQKKTQAEKTKTETQQTLNVIAETALKASQKAKNTADVGLVNKQYGLVDKQIAGFAKDMSFKIVKSLSEQAGMLAQNDIATPDWMTTEMKNSIEAMKA